MRNIKKKGNAFGLVLSALMVCFSALPSQAVPVFPIDTGEVDLTKLASIPAQLNNAQLVKWRGTAGAINVVSPSQMTFTYLQGSNLALPVRGAPNDNSANNQNDLWSDNAIMVNFQKPNDIGSAILIYTNNANGMLNGVQVNAGDVDPIAPVSLRGGLVGGARCNGACLASGNSCIAADLQTCAARASVIPLIWKAATAAQLAAASSVIANTSPLYMPTEIPDEACPTPTVPGSCTTACVAEGPYKVGTRGTAGFCDFSTHYVIDKNNLDPNHLWFQNPAVIDRTGAYNYASLVGPFGANLSDAGLGGGGSTSPMYAVLGTKLTSSIRSIYRTVIYVELLAS